MQAVLPLLFSLPLVQPGVQSDLPDAESILADYQAAVGAQGPGSVRALVTKGKCEWVGLDQRGVLEEAYGSFGEFKSISRYESFGTFELASAGGSYFWEESPLGITIRLGWDGAQFLRMFEVPRHTHWRMLYEKAECVGIEELDDGRKCYVLHLQPKKLLPLQEDEVGLIPPPDIWHVETDSKLLARIELKAAASPVGGAVITMNDYRERDGVRYAHHQEVAISGFQLAVQYDSFEHGSPHPKRFYEPKAEIAAAFKSKQSGADAQRDAAIVVEELEVRHIASVRLETPHADMQKTLSILLPEVMQHVLSQGAPMDGQPLVRYHSFGDTIDLEAAIPVREPITEKGRVKASTLPAGRAALAWHIGPYERLGETYERLEAYLGENGLEAAGAPWEVYWTDPGLEPDPAKWRTRVIWPVREAQGD